MYDDFKIANYSNSLVSPEFYARPLSRLFKGDVIDGLTVVPGTGLKVTLQPGNAMLRYGSAAAASARMVSLVADFSLDIPAPDASNPRIDAVVLYVDNSVNLPIVDASNPPTSANLDGPGVAKARIVSGTPAANPVAPTDVAVQAAVGAGNSFTILALVTVNNGVTVIATDKIKDVRKFAEVGSRNIDYTSIRLGTSERLSDFSSTAALADPAEVPDLSVTFTLARKQRVRAVFTCQGAFNSEASRYIRISLCNGSVSPANDFARANITTLPASNAEIPVTLIGETILEAGTYTFRVALSRSSGTASLGANALSPMRFSVDIIG